MFALFAVALILGTAVQGKVNTCFDLQYILWKAEGNPSDMISLDGENFNSKVTLNRDTYWSHPGTDHSFKASEKQNEKDPFRVLIDGTGYELQKLSIVPVDSNKTPRYHKKAAGIISSLIEQGKKLLGKGQKIEKDDGSNNEPADESTAALQMTFYNSADKNGHVSFIVPLMTKDNGGTLNAALSKDLAALDDIYYKSTYATSFEWFKPLLEGLIRRGKNTKVNHLFEDFPNVILTKCMVVSDLKPFFKTIQGTVKARPYDPLYDEDLAPGA